MGKSKGSKASKAKANGSSSGPSSTGAIQQLLAIMIVLGAMLVGFLMIIDGNLENFYVFKPTELHQLAQKAVKAHGKDTKAMVNYIVDELKITHPEYINTDTEEWMFNNAGGAMGGMYIIHASITEYLIIFGTATGTEGHTGRHTADDYFHMLSGTQTAYSLGAYTPEVYPPASVHHLKRGEVKQYKMNEGAFALEYARGWIPPMLPFGFADALFSTMDLPTLWRTVRITGREMIGNLAQGKF